MLDLYIKGGELYNSETNEFLYIPETKLRLEHSLISLSKWESKWKKPFLDKDYQLSHEESIDYIRCMTITPNVDPIVYFGLDNNAVNYVTNYIDDPMTATWFSDDKKKKAKPSREKITSELIYYWMIAYQIPSQYEKWHLNRLLTLIRICEVKNEAPKKRSAKEIAAENRLLNEQRQAAARARRK